MTQEDVITLEHTAMPLQPFGMGDILYTISLMNDFIADGYDIIYPVKPHFVEGCSRAYPHIRFISDGFVKEEIFKIKKDCVIDGMRILPIRFAEAIMGRPYKYHMISKYQMYGKDWRTWRRDAMPVRDAQKEELLFKLLNINDEPYNLIVKKFGSDAKYVANIEVNNGIKNVEMIPINGFSLFDWCGVIEKASNIHSVSTSTLYLFEILDLKAEEIHLYKRLPLENHFDFVSFLFTKPYILH